VSGEVGTPRSTHRSPAIPAGRRSQGGDETGCSRVAFTRSSATARPCTLLGVACLGIFGGARRMSTAYSDFGPFRRRTCVAAQEPAESMQGTFSDVHHSRAFPPASRAARDRGDGPGRVSRQIHRRSPKTSPIRRIQSGTCPGRIEVSCCVRRPRALRRGLFRKCRSLEPKAQTRLVRRMKSRAEHPEILPFTSTPQPMRSRRRIHLGSLSPGTRRLSAPPEDPFD